MHHKFACCDLRFLPLLSDFDCDALEKGNDIVYGAWPDLTLAYLNPAWFIFAHENKGEPAISHDWILGRSILDSLPLSLHAYYQERYQRCLDERQPWRHVYECSSDEEFRKFHVTVLPLGKSEGLLFVNSLVFESPLLHGSLVLQEEMYVDSSGMIVQCCHCRKFRRADASRAWDWVRPWIKQKPRDTSQAICETCVGYYYSDSKVNDPSLSNDPGLSNLPTTDDDTA